MEPRPSRRHLLRTTLATGVALPVLHACGTRDGSATVPSATPVTPAVPSKPVTVPVADVPSGGGVIIAAEKMVITQPTPGEYRAFSAVCPHEQCLVSRIDEEAITCACHNSRFAVADGAVLAGPSPAALPEYPVVRDGDDLVIG